MLDILEVTPHPEERRTYYELREEFRQLNLDRIRGEYAGAHPLGWNMMGDPDTSRSQYDTESWAREMLLRLDQPVSQDFGLESVPFSLSQKLEELAQKAALHDSVTWDEGEDQDAPACDLAQMSDDQICDYVSTSIEASRNG